MRKLGPLSAGHPALERACAFCHVQFKEGDYLALVAKSDGRGCPADVVGAVEFAATVEAYTVHWDCRLMGGAGAAASRV